MNAVSKVSSDRNSIANRFQIAIDEKAEPTDLDLAVARFLLAFVSRNQANSIPNSSQPSVDGFGNGKAANYPSGQPEPNHPIDRAGRRAIRMGRTTRTCAGGTRPVAERCIPHKIPF
jgi:hypothetical protein